MPTVSARALAALPAVPIAVVVAVIVAVVVDPIVGLVVGVLVGVAIASWILTSATSAALRALGAKEIPEGREPRLESLVESVCAGHGIAEPVTYVVRSDAIDAAVVGRSDDTKLIVTSGLLDSLDRLETEAVVARELSMFGSGIQAATTLVALAPWVGPFGSTIRDRVLDDRRLVRADFDAVEVTRYPPALASVFERVATSPAVAHNDRADHLWMVGSGLGGSQPAATERMDALREL